RACRGYNEYMQEELDTRAIKAPGKRRGWRSWFRFSLASLFICLTIGCLGLGFIANRAHRQRRAVEQIRQYGAEVVYDYELANSELPGPVLLLDRLGIDFLARVGSVEEGYEDPLAPSFDI